MKKSFIKYAKGSVFNSVFWSVKCVKIVGFVYYSGILKLLTLSLHLHRQCLADNVFTICCFMSLHYIYVQSSIGRVSVCLSVCCAVCGDHLSDNSAANCRSDPWRSFPLQGKLSYLYKLLPDKTDHTYNLRQRCHSFSLTVKTDTRNCINRILFKDIY